MRAESDAPQRMSTASDASPRTSVASGEWPHIAIVGAGAVGSYFGAMLARAGAPVTLIGRPAHVEAVSRDGLLLEGVRINERVRVHGATEMSAVRDAQVVLVCVKTVDTEEAARALAPHVGRESTVVSLQNGVDNIERIRAAAGIDALAAVVYVAVAVAGPGHIRHSGRGDLIIGRLQDACEPPSPDLQKLAQMFERAEVPCRVSPDVRRDLWTKMVLNCAYNAISALGRVHYGRMLTSDQTRALMKRVITETVAVAQAEGVGLGEREMTEAAWRLGEAMPAALSSTAQDISRAKPTEIDSLNGYIVRRGIALGVPTPVNQSLHTLVKLLEQSAGQPRPTPETRP